MQQPPSIGTINPRAQPPIIRYNGQVKVWRDLFRDTMRPKIKLPASLCPVAAIRFSRLERPRRFRVTNQNE